MLVISGRSDLTDSGRDAFLASSLDPYAAARSAYLQRRDADIRNLSEEDIAAAANAPDPSLDPTSTDVPPPTDAPAPEAGTGTTTPSPTNKVRP
jgi:phospholipid-binding lipoprotein MlaA